MARRGRGRGRGRGRPKKKVIESDDDEQMIETSEAIDNLVEIPEEPKKGKVPDENVVSHSGHATSRKSSKEAAVPVDSDDDVMTTTQCDYNMDDISTLVPPTFSTLSHAPPQPMLDLNWDHKHVALGERIPSPNVHFCEICRLPVRIYGRMIPCKHIFCHKCACDSGSKCPRCGDKVHRVETSQLGSVFMCSYEGSRYGFDGCRRTYLSQRDLQAHIDHRHKPRSSTAPSPGVSSSKVPAADTSQRSLGFNRSPYSSSHSLKSNLISVPIQGGARGSGVTTHSTYGTSPELPSSSTRFERRGSRSSQGQHESSARNKWAFR